jgi:flagellar basal-body rod modification protein FlgD
MLVAPLQPDGLHTGSTSEQNSSGPAIKGLSQGDFLKLLLTQLQSQDPLKPLDNQEFAAQLATFNSLDQLMGINKKLEATQGLQLHLSQLEATALIGKDVQAKGDRVILAAEGGIVLPYTLDANASRVVINITDGDGKLVRALEAGSQSTGQQTVAWDGRDTGGTRVAPGQYTFAVAAVDSSGTKINTTTFLRGQVTSVNMTGSEPQVEVNGVEVPVSAVTSVRNAE